MRCRADVIAWFLPLTLFLTSRPASAQVDFVGEWLSIHNEDEPHRGPGPEIGDYAGLPINDAARLKADSWDESLLTLKEHQAMPHPSTYSFRGPANIRISKQIDADTQQTVAYEIYGLYGRANRTIWMDGRPHPGKYAPHTWNGFSTGKWEGDMLTVSTTHLKTGWIQRNGVAHSDRATMLEHIVRHGNYLTAVTIVDDPVYLEEPFIRSSNWVLDVKQQLEHYRFTILDEVQSERPSGYVPHHLPGTNPFLTEFARKHHIPFEATRGGAVSTYPEYMLKIAEMTGDAR